MQFRQTGFCRLILLVLSLCILTGTGFTVLSESEMTEEQIEEASERAYEEAMLGSETQIAFTTVVTLGQYLSDLMAYTYGENPASETGSANAAVQLVDEVIRRADLCFRSEKAGTDAERLTVFDRAKEAWITAAVQFGAEGERFEAGLPLVDPRVIDPVADAFDRIPAEAQPVYLEMAEYVYRAIWQVLRPAAAAKAGEALMIPGLEEITGSEKISEIEDAAAEMITNLQEFLAVLSEGFSGERSEARTRIGQVRSRLNTLELEVKLAVHALGIDTVTRLLDSEEK